MILKKRWLFLIALLQLAAHSHAFPFQTALYIDTGCSTAYHYQTLFTLLRKSMIMPTFKAFYNVEPDDIKKAPLIIVALDDLFMQAIMSKNSTQITNPLVVHGKELLTTIAAQKNKILFYLLPNNIPQTADALNQFLFMPNFVAPEHEAAIKPLLEQSLAYFKQPDSSLGAAYDTALLAKKEEALPSYQPVAPIIDKNTVIATMLPYKTTEPLALYLHNTATNNQFFLAKKSRITFAEINENFVYNPIDAAKRQTMLNEILELTRLLYHAQLHKSLPIRNPHLPFLMPAQNGTLRTLDKKIWCGWIALDSYTNKEEQAVKNLLASSLNLWWLEIIPEWYLSPIGLKQAEKPNLIKNISAITDALAKQLKKEQKSPPAIFAGANLTSNLRIANPFSVSIDLFGNQYPNIPSPLDEKFWQQEVIDVLREFCALWPTMNNGIPLAGIFLDFEMYHAPQQTGQYLSCMDFSAISWDAYCAISGDQHAKEYTTLNQRVSYLLTHKKFDTYFAALEEGARMLGQKIRIALNQKYPDLRFAAYNIHLPNTWFYRGIFAGLSTPERPLIIATFNNEYARHASWLKQHGIHLYHLPVLMMSKLRTLDDFKLIDDMAKNNHGLWFNRISRLEESRDKKDWPWDFGAEVTPLATDLVVTHIHNAINK